MNLLSSVRHQIFHLQAHTHTPKNEPTPTSKTTHAYIHTRTHIYIIYEINCSRLQSMHGLYRFTLHRTLYFIKVPTLRAPTFDVASIILVKS